MFKRKNIQQLNDEELLSHYKTSGETTYFGELYNRYIPLLYGVSLNYLEDASKAEDAVMQLFEDLLPKIAQYEIAVFRTWIYTVVKNHCLQILRKEKHQITMELKADFVESDEIVHLLDDETDDDERSAVLQQCIEKLPERQRTTIVRFFIDEQSYAEVADTTGYNLSQVKSYIQNGKRNLKICIEKNSR
ncbi:MAG: sigma-70 family RNA polymerase sigma factor [Candidatus Symbiothrix sp.]|nr:sigma-70 family RNA polymerase sigma factor [Candidatus Symbiothrix sp.]